MGKDVLQTDIIITDIYTKDGERKGGGSYHLTKWTDQNGIKFSTFDTKARDVTRGSKVRLEYTGGEKGNDIVEHGFSVLEGAPEGYAAPTPSGAGNGSKAWERDEALSREDRLTESARRNRSIERQSGAATIMDYSAAIRIAGKELTEDEQVAHDRAVAWITGLYDKAGAVSEDVAQAAAEFGPARPAEPTPPSGNGEKPLRHVGDLLAWCLEKGVDRDAFKNLLHIDEAGVSQINVAEAEQVVKDYLARKPDPAGDIPF